MNYIGAKYDVKHPICTGIDEEKLEDLENGGEQVREM